MKSGIYCIENKLDNKKYIGQSVNLKSRIHSHNYQLLKGVDSCTMLQYAVSKYGLENFEIRVLEYCDESLLNERESFWISNLGSMTPQGYNLRYGGSNGRHSEYVKSKISDSIRGEHNGFFKKKHSNKTKEMMRKLKLGKKKSNTASTYYGVTILRYKSGVRWQAQIRVPSGSKYLGVFQQEVDAAHAYDKYVLESGLDIPTNFAGRFA